MQSSLVKERCRSIRCISSLLCLQKNNFSIHFEGTFLYKIKIKEAAHQVKPRTKKCSKILISQTNDRMSRSKTIAVRTTENNFLFFSVRFYCAIFTMFSLSWALFLILHTSKTRLVLKKYVCDTS